MRRMKPYNLLLATAITGSLAIAASSAVSAGTWVAAVPYPNSTVTTVFGINDKNIIAGNYFDSRGIEHGFVGPFDGSDYTSFDDPGGNTNARGINDKRYIVGFEGGNTLVPWERTPEGVLTTVTQKGKPLNGFAQGLNSRGVFAGSYLDANGISVGYLGQKSRFKSKFKLSIKNSGYAGRAINGAGDIAGWYYDSSSVQHGFLISGGNANSVDYPNAILTTMQGLNDKGVATGQYEDSSGVTHGFIYEITSGKMTSIDAPGATKTQAWGVNNDDVIAVSTENVGSFVYCIKKSNCPATAAGVTHAPQRGVSRSIGMEIQ